MYYKGRQIRELGRTNSDLHGFGDSIRQELSKRLPAGALKALDVGTGFGITTEFLARNLSPDSVIWTLDPSAEVLERARESLRGKRLASRIRFVHGSLGTPKLRSGFFDLLVSVMVLHHLEDLPSTVAEMARILGDSGLILIVDYSPKASHELEFKVEHREEDFFKASEVAAELRRRGFATRVSDFGLWYLVEGRRKSRRLRSATMPGQRLVS